LMGRLPQPYRDLWRTRGKDWLIGLTNGLMADESRWMGVRCQKNPLDAWIYQELLYELRPQTVVELGNAYGGSALFLAHMLDVIGGGKVVAVDHSHAVFEANHPRITKVTGKTHDVVDEVAGLCEGKTLVIHDASHRADDVLVDLHAYAPLVSAGCYLIVEDSAQDLLIAAPGPLRRSAGSLRRPTTSR
jgi:cephalosporin hydroxylase